MHEGGVGSVAAAFVIVALVGSCAGGAGTSPDRSSAPADEPPPQTPAVTPAQPAAGWQYLSWSDPQYSIALPRDWQSDDRPEIAPLSSDELASLEPEIRLQVEDVLAGRWRLSARSGLLSLDQHPAQLVEVVVGQQDASLDAAASRLEREANGEAGSVTRSSAQTAAGEAVVLEYRTDWLGTDMVVYGLWLADRQTMTVRFYGSGNLPEELSDFAATVMATLTAGVGGPVPTIVIVDCPALTGYPGATGQLVFKHTPDELDYTKTTTCVADLETGLSRLVYDGVAREPALSPDGRWIAFADDVGLQIISSDGSGTPRRLVTDGTNPAWSPDGRFIAYDVGTSSGSWVVEVATGKTQLLVAENDDPNNLGRPSWSPDGDRLVLSHGGRLWTVRADGTNLAPLVSDDAMALDPEWSPDGSVIAFVREDLKAGGPSETTIYTVKADGSGLQRLVTPPWDEGYYVNPTWSPDGQYLAFNSGLTDVRIVRFDGSSMQTVLSEAYFPDWGPSP